MFKIIFMTAGLSAVFLILALSAPAQTVVTSGDSAKTFEKKDVPVNQYDEKRDAQNDIQAALVEAQKSKKNVLLEIGGKWCVWCRIMDKYFENNIDLLKLREANYVTVKINFSQENENQATLSKYPEIIGYPHLFVLDADGKLLYSQNTSELEEGKSYNLERFTNFLKKWSPAK